MRNLNSSPVSPKVIASVLVGIVLTGVATALEAMDEGVLSWAGEYAGPLALGIATIASGIAGWAKRDFLRDGFDESGISDDEDHDELEEEDGAVADEETDAVYSDYSEAEDGIIDDEDEPVGADQ